MPGDADPCAELSDPYAASMDRVFRYIDARLGEDLDLGELASVAAYSKYHFSRVFRAAAGEGLAAYLVRRRLEKAAARLLADRERTVTEVAASCGFASPAAFSKGFRDRFGTTPTAWRRAGGRGPGGDGPGRLRGPAGPVRIRAADGPGFRGWIVGDGSGERRVALERPAPATIACLSAIGPYRGDAALFARLFGGLFSRLRARGLVSEGKHRAVVVYHDDPDLTAGERLRISVGFEVPAGTAAEVGVGVMEFDPGACAVGAFRCAPDGFQAAWDWMYGTWLPACGCRPADVPPFERYGPGAFDPATGLTAVEICVPLERP